MIEIQAPKDTTPRAKRAKTKPQPPKSDGFTKIVKATLGVTVEMELKFHPTRKWRFDYAIPEHRIAIEVEGGVWTGGRHTRPAGFLKDITKYNQAALLGWRVFRVTPKTLITTETIEMIKDALATTVSQMSSFPGAETY